MTAEAEEWRATALRGEETDLAARVKLENVITRIRRELVLDRPRQKPAPTLAEYVARRAAA